MKRLGFVDTVKGIAIICVVIGHIANGYLNSNTASNIAVYQFIYNVIYSFHMPLFFLISGFVFAHSYVSFGMTIDNERVRKQIYNLIYIYFLFSVVMGISKMVLGAYVNEPTGLKDILCIPLFPIQLYWYIYVLIFYYLIVSILISNHVKFRFIIPVAFILSIASYYLPSGLAFDLKRLLYYCFFFCLGICREQAHKNIWTENALIRRIILLLSIIVIYVNVWNNNRVCEVFVVNVLVGMVLSISIFDIFEYKLYDGNRGLSYIGKNALVIYLIHSYILTALRVFYDKLLIDNCFIILMTGTILGVLIPMMFAIFSKKLRLYSFFFDITKKMNDHVYESYGDTMK